MAAAELRFTRSGQAVTFVILGIVAFSAAIGLTLLGWRWPWRGWPEPLLPSPWWGVAVLPLAIAAFWFAARLTRTPYLVFTPVGLEIYPFFRPAQHSQLVTWSEVAVLEHDDRREQLTVHFRGQENAGVVLTLAPLSRKSQALLARTVAGMPEKLARS